MRIIIVEDEHLAASRLSQMITNLFPQSQICTICDSVEQTIEWLGKHPHPELAFFDIQLGDDLSFEIFEQCQVTFPVIFTTAYDQYAVRAFKVNGLDYLLKPVDQDELKAAVEKYLHTQKPDLSAFNVALSQLNQSIQQKNYKTRYLIKVGEHLRMINTNDISFFFSESKATYVRTTQGASYAMDQSLEQIEMQLDPNQFFRISRKHLVHINAINDIVNYGISRLKLKLVGMETNDEMTVSRERVKLFKAWLEQETTIKQYSN